MTYLQNRLVSCIYDMALRHSSWDDVLDILSSWLPGCLIMISADDISRKLNIGFAQRGLTSAAAVAYAGTYAAINPWLARQAEMAAYQIFHDEQLLPRETAWSSPFFTEWLSPQGDFSASTGVVLLREGVRQLTLEIRYPADDRSGIRAQVDSLLAEAVSHFRRAFEIARRSRFATSTGYLDSVVEDLPFPVFFVNEDMRIQYCNFHAENMRRHGQGPVSGMDGVLRVADAQTDAALRQLVGRITLAKRTPTSVLQVSRPEWAERYFVIGRLAGRSSQTYQLHDAILDPGPLVMLVFHGSLETASLPMDLLWRAFSLTESEAQLAGALLGGETLADFARQRAVSKQTLRNQLVGVMRKTGTRRQSELVSLLTRLALTCL